MKFKVGDRIVLDGEPTLPFRDLKGIVVSEMEFLKYRPSSHPDSGFLLFKADKRVLDHNYWQVRSDLCSLLPPIKYND